MSPYRVQYVSQHSSHRRDDSWQDLDVFATYHSKHHQYLSLGESNRGSPRSRSWFATRDEDDERGCCCCFSLTARRWTRKLWAHARVSILLALVGASAALLSAALDAISWKLRELRRSLVGPSAQLFGMGMGMASAASWLKYITFSVTLACASCALTHTVAPQAAGSGVPEMKTVLSGVMKPSLLSLKALCAKLFGLALALGAGLSIGQEGPAVHVAMAVADVLMRSLGCFHPIVSNDATRLDVLGAAAAGGVAACFGTPFCGAVFSIEITASTYNIGMLPQALFCALSGVVLLQLLGLSRFTSIIDVKSLVVAKSILPIDLAAFVALGLLCGLLGAVYVRIIASLARYRNAYIKNGFRVGILCRASDEQGLDDTNTGQKASGGTVVSTVVLGSISEGEQQQNNCGFSWLRRLRGDVALRRKLKLVLAAMMIIAPLVYFDMMFGLAFLSPEMEATAIIFDKDALSGENRWRLNWYVPYKFVVTALSVALPLPAGVFKPTFVLGAAIGRAVGELLHRVIRLSAALSTTAVGLEAHLEPWEYAVIGASAFCAGVTRTVSTPLLFFELAGENHLGAPLLIATLVAYFVGNCFTASIYDALAYTNGAPTLPALLDDDHAYLPARAVMQPVASVRLFNSPLCDEAAVPYIRLDSTYAELDALLSNPKCHGLVLLPVVEDARCHALVGLARLSDVRSAVRAFGQRRSVSPAVGRGAPRSRSSSDEGSSISSVPSVFDEPDQPAESPVATGVSRSAFGNRIFVGQSTDAIPPSRRVSTHRRYPSINESSPLKGADFWNVRVNYVVNISGRALPVAFARSGTTESFWPPVLLDASPYQIVDTMALFKVDLIFRTLKVNSAHVTQAGTLVGVITRSRLRDVLNGTFTPNFDDGTYYSSDRASRPTTNGRRRSNPNTIIDVVA